MRLPDLRFTIYDLRTARACDKVSSSLVTGHSSPRSGVALVITLVMLSVITFLAVTFLLLATREKNTVTTATDQTIARLAADAALERAKAELLAGILSTKNVANYGLLVSTNFINRDGFTAGTVFDPRTNVNFDYTVGGGVLNAAERLQNLANLFYDPRPPVAITNRLAPPNGSNEFRFYLDLNRNRRFDHSGLWPLINPNGGFYLADGTESATIPAQGVVSNFFTGDPEWIGGLERPDLPYSATNKFIYRYAYLAMPAGRALDVNYMHNASAAARRLRVDPLGSDYYRNQGAGTWELNLGAFLYDLNTNSAYGWGVDNLGYRYDSLTGVAAGGKSFEDAGALYRYRINGNPNLTTYNLARLSTLFNGAGNTPFRFDYIDGYADGPLQTTNFWGLTTDNDQPTLPWLGADNPYHFFTTQDLFDRAKTAVTGGGLKFPDRLEILGTNLSSYDSMTFYRLLEQLGTDSASEDPDKLNLNYKNTEGWSATNFVAWTPVDFFTNAANRLLQQYTAEWLSANVTAYTNDFGVSTAFGVTNIPVFINNRFVYKTSVHRLLQLTANIYDASTNRYYGGVPMPTVFRPIFEVQGGDVYISGFREVTDAATVLASQLRDLATTNAVAALQPNDLVFGVPLVIGAKTGFPNFNEFAMQNVFQITRKLQVRRDSTSVNGRPNATNMMYTLSISNAVGLEAWNSYATNFNRPLELYVTNYMIASLTNSDRTVSRVWPMLATMGTNFTTGVWSAYNKITPRLSFLIPFQTNLAVIPEQLYNFTTHNFEPISTGFRDTGAGFPQPQWGLNITNKLQFVMVDSATRRIIDYVHMSDLQSNRDLSDELRDPANAQGFDGLWKTNRLNKNLLPDDNNSLPEGVFHQINISMGNEGGTTTDWKSYSPNAPNNTKAYEIDYFRVFMSSSTFKFGPLNTYQSPIVVTSTVAQVPFTPTKRIARFYTWQANDPFVHYTSQDLRYLAVEDDKRNYSRLANVPTLEEQSLGKLNTRYQPWGGNPEKPDPNNDFNLALKDPLMRTSDDWQFTTNKYPNIGWLGRVHRGTPWQTVYMKAYDVDGGAWTNWTGNANPDDAARTHPVQDRSLFDQFTTAFNDNATRGQLSINQTGLAAWSAVFAGLVALTNSSTDTELNRTTPLVRFDPLVIPPAGVYDAVNSNAWPAIVRLVDGINRERVYTNNHPDKVFERLGDIFSVPELTDKSPFLRTNGVAKERGLNDQVYEWLPQQVLSLLRLGEPRFVVYAYGQALRPAEGSVYTGSGAFFGMVTNYQVMAEVATRAVVRVEGSPDPTKTSLNLPAAKRYPPRLVVESYNLLPPD